MSTKIPKPFNIPLELIDVNPNNPRSGHINQKTIEELAQSIKENGLLSPIGLRFDKKSGRYMVIYGERRFNAVKHLGEEYIESRVYDISQAEADSMMIVENLQREDIDPISECVAYAKFAEENKMTAEQVAQYVGRSVSYVAKRMQLQFLTPFFQNLLKKTKITLEKGLMISRFNTETQNRMKSEFDSDSWSYGNQTSTARFKEFLDQNYTYSLSSGKFDKKDPDLVPEQGACEGCPFNTKSQSALFDDYKGATCTKPSCFDMKVAVTLRNKVTELVDKNPEAVILKNERVNYHDTSSQNKTLENIKDVVEIKSSKDFVIIEKPSQSLPPKPTKPTQKEIEQAVENGEYDDIEEATKYMNESYEEDLEIYNDAVSEFRAEEKKYEENKKNPNAVDAIIIGANNEYQKIKVIPKGAGAVMEAGVIKFDAKDSDPSADLLKMEEKFKRNKELVMIKIRKDLRQKQDDIIGNEYSEIDATLMRVEEDAFWWAMMDKYGYQVDFDLNDFDNVDNPANLKYASTLTQEQKNRLMRAAIMDRILTQSDDMINQHSSAFFAQVNILREMNKEAVNQIIFDNTQLYAKRQANLTEKIGKLREQLKPVPEASAEETTSDKVVKKKKSRKVKDEDEDLSAAVEALSDEESDLAEIEDLDE